MPTVTVIGRALALTALLAGVLAAPGVGAAPPPLEVRSLLGGRVEMLVPRGFQPMPEELVRRKYPSERRPTLVLANDAGSVSVALNHTRDTLPGGRLPEAHRAFERMFRNLFPSAQWFRSEVTSLNGRAVMLLDLRTPAVDTEIRNLMLGTSVDDRLLLVTVNMTKELEGEWLDAATRMVRSVVVRP